jgi:hypothetical protein
LTNKRASVRCSASSAHRSTATAVTSRACHSSVAGTRRSAEWTHLTAGDESSVVLACKLVNRMQTDLTEGEFEMLVKALARCFDGEPFDEAAFPLEPE